MISLKQLLQEQDEENFVFSDEFMNEVKKAADAETEPFLKAMTSAFYDVLFPAVVGIGGMIAAGLFTLAFRKQIISRAGKMWKSSYNPVKLVGKQIAIHAPMKAFLRLDKDGAAIWTQNAILSPLKRIKSANSASSKIYQEADRLEGLILSRMDPDDFVKLAMATRKQFQSKTYDALRTLRQTSGRGYIKPDLQVKFEKLFAELNKINSSIFDENYIRVTLNSLDISIVQQDKMLTKIFYKYQAPIRPTMLTTADLQATQKSGTIGKLRGSFAQGAYMMSLPTIADRKIFANIVNNLSTEIQKRKKYVDDLMDYAEFPDLNTWLMLDIPNKEQWIKNTSDTRFQWGYDPAGQIYHHNLDKLFYNANKLSGPTIK